MPQKGVNIRWIEEHSHPENAVISPRYWYTSIKGPPDKPSDLHAESPPHDGIVKSNHSKKHVRLTPKALGAKADTEAAERAIRTIFMVPYWMVVVVEDEPGTVT